MSYDPIPPYWLDDEEDDWFPGDAYTDETIRRFDIPQLMRSFNLEYQRTQYGQHLIRRPGTRQWYGPIGRVDPVTQQTITADDRMREMAEEWTAHIRETSTSPTLTARERYNLAIGKIKRQLSGEPAWGETWEQRYPQHLQYRRSGMLSVVQGGKDVPIEEQVTPWNIQSRWGMAGMFWRPSETRRIYDELGEYVERKEPMRAIPAESLAAIPGVIQRNQTTYGFGGKASSVPKRIQLSAQEQVFLEGRDQRESSIIAQNAKSQELGYRMNALFTFGVPMLAGQGYIRPGTVTPVGKTRQSIRLDQNEVGDIQLGNVGGVATQMNPITAYTSAGRPVTMRPPRNWNEAVMQDIQLRTEGEGDKARHYLDIDWMLRGGGTSMKFGGVKSQLAEANLEGMFPTLGGRADVVMGDIKNWRMMAGIVMGAMPTYEIQDRARKLGYDMPLQDPKTHAIRWNPQADPAMQAVFKDYVKENIIQLPYQMTVSRGNLFPFVMGKALGRVPQKFMGGMPEFVQRAAMPGVKDIRSMGQGMYQVSGSGYGLLTPALLQFRREWEFGRTRLGPEEMASMWENDPQQAARLERYGSAAREPYSQVMRVAALGADTTGRQQTGPTRAMSSVDMAQIMAKAMEKYGTDDLSSIREDDLMELLGKKWASLNTLATLQFEGDTHYMMSPSAVRRLSSKTGTIGAGGSTIEANPFVRAYTKTWLAANRMQEAPTTAAVEAYRAARAVYDVELGKLSSAEGIQTRASDTPLRQAMEGTFIGSLALNPGEILMGRARMEKLWPELADPKVWQNFQDQLQKQALLGRGHRRPISDMAQMGGLMRMVSQEEYRGRQGELTLEGNELVTDLVTASVNRGDFDADRFLAIVQSSVSFKNGMPQFATPSQMRKRLGYYDAEAGRYKLATTGNVGAVTKALESQWSRRLISGFEAIAPGNQLKENIAKMYISAVHGPLMQELQATGFNEREARAFISRGIGMTGWLKKDEPGSNEIAKWIEDIQKYDSPDKIYKAIDKAFGAEGDISLADIRSASAHDLQSKALMGITYDLFRRNMEGMMHTRAGTRGLAEGYQTALDRGEFSYGMRAYLSFMGTWGVTGRRATERDEKQTDKSPGGWFPKYLTEEEQSQIQSFWIPGMSSAKTQVAKWLMTADELPKRTRAEMLTSTKEGAQRLLDVFRGGGSLEDIVAALPDEEFSNSPTYRTASELSAYRRRERLGLGEFFHAGGEEMLQQGRARVAMKEFITGQRDVEALKRTAAGLMTAGMEALGRKGISPGMSRVLGVALRQMGVAEEDIPGGIPRIRGAMPRNRTAPRRVESAAQQVQPQQSRVAAPMTDLKQAMDWLRGTIGDEAMQFISTFGEDRSLGVGGKTSARGDITLGGKFYDRGTNMTDEEHRLYQEHALVHEFGHVAQNRPEFADVRQELSRAIGVSGGIAIRTDQINEVVERNKQMGIGFNLENEVFAELMASTYGKTGGNIIDWNKSDPKVIGKFKQKIRNRMPKSGSGVAAVTSPTPTQGQQQVNQKMAADTGMDIMGMFGGMIKQIMAQVAEGGPVSGRFRIDEATGSISWQQRKERSDLPPGTLDTLKQVGRMFEKLNKQLEPTVENLEKFKEQLIRGEKLTKEEIDQYAANLGVWSNLKGMSQHMAGYIEKTAKKFGGDPRLDQYKRMGYALQSMNEEAELSRYAAESWLGLKVGRGGGGGGGRGGLGQLLWGAGPRGGGQGSWADYGLMGGAAGLLNKFTSGWELMRMQRLWSLTGAPTFNEYIPAAAQAEMTGWQASQAIGGYSGGLPGGVAGGVMQYQAAKQQAAIDAGRAGYAAWGWTQRASSDLTSIKGVFGPAAGVGLIGGGLATTIGSTLGVGGGGMAAAASTIGLPVTIGLGSAAGLGAQAMLAYNYSQPTAENALMGYNWQRSGGGLNWEGMQTSYGTMGLAARAVLDQIKSGSTIDIFEGPDSAWEIAKRERRAMNQEGARIVGTPLGQLSSVDRAAALNDLAQKLQATKGSIWSGMDENTILGLVQSTAPFEDISKYSDEQIVAMGGTALQQRVAGTGRTPAEYANIASAYGYGTQKATSMFMRGTAMPFAQEQAWQGALGQWAPMTQLGMDADTIMQMVGSSQLQRLTGSEAIQLGQAFQANQQYYQLSGGTQIGATRQWLKNGATTQAAATILQSQLGNGSLAAAVGMIAGGDIASQFESGITGLMGQNQLNLNQYNQLAGMMQYGGGALGYSMAAGGWGGGAAINATRNAMGMQSIGGGALYEQGPYGGIYSYGTLQNREMAWSNINASQAYQMTGMNVRLGQLRGNLAHFQQMNGLQDQYTAAQQEASNAGIRRAMESAQLQFRQGMESLGLSQEMWGVQTGFQRQQFGTQWQQMLQARQWGREDMAFNRQMSGLEFGWQQEDLDRSIRFATGRQKEQLIRQRERGEERYALQEGRRATTEERQEKVWSDEEAQFATRQMQFEEIKALENEQFEMRRQHMIESFEMQMRHLNEQLGEQNKLAALQKEMQKLDREHQEDNMKLAIKEQEREIAYYEEHVFPMQRERQELQDEIEDRQAKYLQNQIDDMSSGGKLWNAWEAFINRIIARLEGDTGSTTGGGAGQKKRQLGGPVRAGESYWVGESGPEPFIPDVNGYLLPSTQKAGSSVNIAKGAVNVTIDTGGVAYDEQMLADLVARRLEGILSGLAYSQENRGEPW